MQRLLIFTPSIHVDAHCSRCWLLRAARSHKVIIEFRRHGRRPSRHARSSGCGCLTCWRRSLQGCRGLHGRGKRPRRSRRRVVRRRVVESCFDRACARTCRHLACTCRAAASRTRTATVCAAVASPRPYHRIIGHVSGCLGGQTCRVAPCMLSTQHERNGAHHCRSQQRSDTHDDCAVEAAQWSRRWWRWRRRWWWQRRRDRERWAGLRRWDWRRRRVGRRRRRRWRRRRGRRGRHVGERVPCVTCKE
jgi:hypothetical protein